MANKEEELRVALIFAIKWIDMVFDCANKSIEVANKVGREYGVLSGLLPLSPPQIDDLRKLSEEPIHGKGTK